MTDMARRATDGWRRAHLDDLAAAMHSRGFDAEVGTSKTGVPVLTVTNRQVPLFQEAVQCAQEPDGTLALFFEWGQRITDAADTTSAAVVVSQVLRSRDG